MNTKTTPRDFFLHLGIIIALYVSSISLLSVLFQVIDLAFPDALQGYYDPYSTTMRLAIASLIIFSPVYILLGWMYNKELKVNSEKKNVGIRRWLVYFTLFITGLTIIIDLVVLLNSFLGGEISSRFVLKVLAVAILAGLIFAYYILSLRGTTSSKNVFNSFVGVAVALVVLTLGFGFYFMGSPTTQRQIRFDAQRTEDLQNIQYQAITYWQQKQKLPASVADLTDPISNYAVPVDPETAKSYEYKVVSSTSFELCATFDISSRALTLPVERSGDSWQHEAGRTCFTRTIDPQKYPPFPSKI